MSVLVTGGAGFIGSNLVEALGALGQKVIVLDDLSTGSMENLEGISLKDLIEKALRQYLTKAIEKKGGK